MSTIEKVSISLTSDQLGALRAAVEGGDYATTSEAVREAIRDWQTKRQLQRMDIDHLRRLWDEGVSSGVAEPREMSELRLQARKRLDKARKMAGGIGG